MWSEPSAGMLEAGNASFINGNVKDNEPIAIRYMAIQ
jgi:hypothetical protein